MSQPAVHRLARAMLAAIVTAVVAGCGGGGNEAEEPPANRWNEMNWDQGQWS